LVVILFVVMIIGVSCIARQLVGPRDIRGDQQMWERPLKAHHFDLWQLTSAKKTKDDFTLRFTGRTRISVPPFTEGRGVFRTRIMARLETNGR